jgi:hypothetical protein
MHSKTTDMRAPHLENDDDFFTIDQINQSIAQSPKLVDVEHSGKRPLVVVHRNQFVLVKDEEAESGLLKHAVLFLLPLGPLQVRRDQDRAVVPEEIRGCQMR